MIGIVSAVIYFDLSFDGTLYFLKLHVFPSLRYKLAHDPANWVTVDEHSGAVVTRKQVDRESPYVNDSFYTIIVHAVDDSKCFPKTGVQSVFSCFLRENDPGESAQLGETETVLSVCIHTGD